MRPTFLGFETTKRGLAAAQKSLDIVGNNLSNIDTPGYTRQRVDLCSIAPSTYATRFVENRVGMAGQGVETLGVSQTRDAFLDKRFRQEYGDASYYDKASQLLSELESTVNEHNTNSGLKGSIAEIYNALIDFSSNPTSSTHSNLVLSAFKNICTTLQQFSKKMDNIQSQYEYDLGLDVNKVNSIFEELRDLNRTIGRDVDIVQNTMDTEYFGPNELLDARNLLLDELAQYGEVTIKEGQSGVLDVYLNGHLAVKGRNSFDTIEAPAKDAAGYVGIKWKSDGSDVVADWTTTVGNVVKNINIPATAAGGGYTLDFSTLTQSDLKALVGTDFSFGCDAATDNVTFKFVSGTGSTVQNADPDNPVISIGIDDCTSGSDLADKIAQVYTNGLNSTNYHPAALTSAGGVLTISNAREATSNVTARVGQKTMERGKAYKGSLSASIDYINGTGVNVKDKHMAPDEKGNEVTYIGNFKECGVPYYKEQINTFARKLVEFANSVIPTGMDADGNPLTTTKQLLTGKDLSADFDLMEITADNICVTEDWIRDPDYFMYDPGNEINNSYALKLNTLLTTDTHTFGIYPSIQYDTGTLDADNNPVFKSVDGDNITLKKDGGKSYLVDKVTGDYVDEKGRKVSAADRIEGQAANIYTENYHGTLEGFVNHYVGQLGEQKGYVDGCYTSSADISNELLDRRDAVAAVVRDEEVSSMLMYQKTYSAVARIMTALDEALDVLINKTGMVGR